MISELVTIVIPVRDEEATVPRLLESLSRQSIGTRQLEVLIYDGESQDGTRSVCARYAGRAQWGHFEVRRNRHLTVPRALNDALSNARGRWYLRLDGRTRISDNYLEACLERIRTEPGVVASGGRLEAEAKGSIAKAIAAAVTHPFVVGRGFRTESHPTEVPHHPFALWETAHVRAIGGFQPSLARNQDDEFSMRARRSGARILLEPRATVVYRPRDRLRGLGMQYFQYGLWKSVVARKGGGFPARSVGPSVVTITVVGAILVALSGRSRLPAAACGSLYIGLGLIVSRRRRAQPFLTALAALTVHASYGAGVLAGSVRPSLAYGRLGSARVR